METEKTVRALAEQAYIFHLLVKTLQECGQLQPGEPVSRWNGADFEEFLRNFRNHYFPEES